jgi:hypothetical protein
MSLLERSSESGKVGLLEGANCRAAASGYHKPAAVYKDGGTFGTVPPPGRLVTFSLGAFGKNAAGCIAWRLKLLKERVFFP